MSAGIKVAAIGDQVLVSYREKFYVVEKDAAHTKGGKALRYSKSSLPAVWKRALRGEMLPAGALVVPADDALPVSTITKRERVRKKNPQSPALLPPAVQSPAVGQPVVQTATAGAETIKKAHRMHPKPTTQPTVAAMCPNCSYKHDIPLEKGKNGKPFFMACARCKVEFAVRFVPVTAYKAQVAGFR